MHGKFVLKLVLFCGLAIPQILLATRCLYEEVAKGDFGVGLNYPGVGVRYFLSDKISLKAKGQFEKDILVGGLRGYWYFSRIAMRPLLFAGVEADFVSFKSADSEGTGIAGELFVV